MNVAPTIPVDKQMTPRQQGPGYTYGIVLGNRASCLSDEHPARSLWEVDTGRKGAAGHRDSGRRAPETCAPFLGQQGGARSSAFRGLCSGYRNPVSCGRRRRSGLGRTKGGFVRAAVGRPASVEEGVQGPANETDSRGYRLRLCRGKKELKPEPARPAYQRPRTSTGRAPKRWVSSLVACVCRQVQSQVPLGDLHLLGGWSPILQRHASDRASECSPITRPHDRLAGPSPHPPLISPLHSWS